MADEIQLSDGSTTRAGHALRSSVPVRGETDTLGVFVEPGKPTLVESTINDTGALSVPGVRNIAAIEEKRAKEPPAVAKPLTKAQKKKLASQRAKDMWTKRRSKMAGVGLKFPVEDGSLAAHAAVTAASSPMRHDLPEPVEEISTKGKKDPYRAVSILLPDMRDAGVSECEAAILESRKLTDVYAQTLQDLSNASRDLTCEYCHRVIRESQGDRPYTSFCPIDPNGRAGKRLVWCSQTCDVQWKMQNPTWRPSYMQTNLAVR